MQSITSVDGLREAIVALESRRREQELELTIQLGLFYDSLRPVNIIKNTVRDLAGSSQVRQKVLTAAVGMASGYISRKLFFPLTSGPVKKIIGAALQLGIAGLVTGKGGGMKTGGLRLLRSVLVARTGDGSR
jgi:hypothetical protein